MASADTKYQKLFEFCIKGDRIGLADYIITNKCNPSAYDAKDVNGQTALHIACQYGHLFVVRSLIEVFGCSPANADKSKNIPLHVACLHGHLSIVDYLFSLVKDKESSNLILTPDSNGNNLLHKACQSGSVATVRYILHVLCYPKKEHRKLNLYEDSIIVYDTASSAEHLISQVKLIAKYALKVNSLGENAIHVACRHGHLMVLKLFQAFFPYNGLLESLMLIAIQCGHMNIINYLGSLRKQPIIDFNSELPDTKRAPTNQSFKVKKKKAYDFDSSKTLICQNCGQLTSSRDFEIFDDSTLTGRCPNCWTDFYFTYECRSCFSVSRSQKMLQVICLKCKGSELNLVLPPAIVFWKGTLGARTGLMRDNVAPEKRPRSVIPFYRVQHTIKAAAMRGDMELYEQVPSRFSSTEKSILHAACISDNVDLVKHIIKTLNVSINEIDTTGNTPLHIVCEWGSWNVFSFLLSFSELKLTVINNDNQTPLSLACKYSREEFICKLLEYDIKDDRNALHIACGNGQLGLIKKLMKCFGPARIDCVDKHGDTLLFDACRRGNLELVQFLVTEGFNPLFVNETTKDTPVHIACRMNRQDILEALCRSQLIKDHSLELNILGLSPIHFAIENNCFRLVEILIKYCSIDLNVTVNSNRATLTQFFYLIQELRFLNILLQEPSVDWNAQDSAGNTLLHLACIDNNIEIVKLVAKCASKSMTIQNAKKKTPVHIAVMKQNLALLTVLLQDFSGSLDECVDEKNNTILHVACQQTFDDKSLKVNIISLLSKVCSVIAQNDRRETPIHVACKMSNLQIVETLVSKTTDVVYSSSGDSYLHSAYQGKKSLKIVTFLLNDCQLDSQRLLGANNEGNTPLHTACLFADSSAELIKSIWHHCSTQTLRLKNSMGKTPFCCLLVNDNTSLIKDLIADKTIDAQWIWDDQPLLHSIIENASNKVAFDLIKFIVSGKYFNPLECDESGNTILHCYVHRSSRFHHYHHPATWCYLLEIPGIGINEQNQDGNTALHLLCMIKNKIPMSTYYSTSLFDRTHEAPFAIELIKPLYAHAESIIKESISSRNKQGKTPIQLVQLTNKRVMRLLITYGANPEDVYSEFGPILDKFKREHPLKSPMKIIVVGNSTAGKTTLVEALNQLVSNEQRNTLSAVESVEGPTAGVKKSTLESKDLGLVSFHDFAGQPEFESSNSSFLENSLSPDQSPIFLLLADVSSDYKTLEMHTQYWFTFIQNHSPQQLETAPHVIVIGSHSDRIEKSQYENVEKCMKKAIDSIHSSFSVKGPLLLDCRQVKDSNLEKLNQMLAKSCSSLRKTVEMDIRCHILFAFLSSLGKEAVKFTTIQQKLKPDHASQEFPLPSTTDALFDLLKSLHAGGHILFLNTESTEDCWVVMENDSLFKKVNGSLFAPESFDGRKLPPNTGVVSDDMLLTLFGKSIDIKLITAYTVYSEFCQKIQDSVTLKLIEGSCEDEDSSSLSTNPIGMENSSPNKLQSRDSAEMVSMQNYYFFPCFVKCEQPANIWDSSSSTEVQNFGWYLECNANNFLDPRFLYVVLLRLTFTFAAVSSTSSSQGSLERRCSIWKNGIHWSTTRGVEVLVEVIEQNSAVVFLVRCFKGHEMEGIKLRSQIISMILKTKDQFCPKTEVTEYILTECSEYPSDIQDKIPVREIAQSIAKRDSCVLNSKHKPLLLEDLLFFDPYLKIGENLIDMLWSEEFSEEDIPSSFLSELSDAQHTYMHQVTELLKVRQRDVDAEKEKCGKEPIKLLHHIYELWKIKQDKPTFKVLLEVFNSYSIFCGRNPIEVKDICTDVSPSSKQQPEKLQPTKSVYDDKNPTLESATEEKPFQLPAETEARLDSVSIKKHFMSITYIHVDHHTNAERRVCILKDASLFWQNIARTLGMPPEEISALEEAQQPQQDCASSVFDWWLDNENRYKKTWCDLCQLLSDSGLPMLAKEIRKALVSPKNSVLRSNPYIPKLSAKGASNQRKKRKPSGASNY